MKIRGYPVRLIPYFMATGQFGQGLVEYTLIVALGILVVIGILGYIAPAIRTVVDKILAVAVTPHDIPGTCNATGSPCVPTLTPAP